MPSEKALSSAAVIMCAVGSSPVGLSQPRRGPVPKHCVALLPTSPALLPTSSHRLCANCHRRLDTLFVTRQSDPYATGPLFRLPLLSSRSISHSSRVLVVGASFRAITPFFSKRRFTNINEEACFSLGRRSWRTLFRFFVVQSRILSRVVIAP